MNRLPMALIVLGIAMVGYWGYTYSQNRETAGIGDIEISVSESTSPVPGIIGAILILGGVVMGRRKQT